MPIINAATFVATAEPGQYGTDGTVEATVNGQTRRVRAFLAQFQAEGSKRAIHEIRAYGIAGRYPTGAKVWPCHVTLDIATGRESFGGGFDNRATRSRITSLVGFMADIDPRYHTGR